MTAGDRLRLEIALDGEPGTYVATIEVIGEFDRLQVEKFDQAVSALPPVLASLAVDLTATTIVDSAALGALIRLQRGLADGCRLRVLVHEPFQVTVMDVSGLDDLLSVERV